MLDRVNPHSSISATPAWQALQQHRGTHEGLSLQRLFAEDERRFERLSFSFDDLLYDFSKNLLTHQTLELLVELARTADLKKRIESLFSGDPVNTSENRPALHTALRRFDGAVMVEGADVMPDVLAAREYSSLWQPCFCRLLGAGFCDGLLYSRGTVFWITLC